MCMCVCVMHVPTSMPVNALSAVGSWATVGQNGMLSLKTLYLPAYWSCVE